MLTDTDVYVLRKNPWKYFEKECKGKNFWITTMEDATSDLKLDVLSSVRGQIANCFGREVLEGMMKSGMVNANFPIAGKSSYLLKLVSEGIRLRLNITNAIHKHNSNHTICDMVGKLFHPFFFSFELTHNKNRHSSYMHFGRMGG